MPSLIDLPRNAPAVAARHHTFSTHPSVLEEILEPGFNLAIYQRPPREDCLPAVGALLRAIIPAKIDLKNPSAADLADAIACTIGPTAPHASILSLAEDIAHLSSLFARIAGTRHPRVRLERVADDGCALFHADSLSLRLLCTYAGPGTEWLENSNARRHELGLRSRTIPEANRAIIIDSSKIRSIATWHAAIFSGRAHPGGEENALIHRSAPVLFTNATRLRLCIDLPGDCGC